MSRTGRRSEILGIYNENIETQDEKRKKKEWKRHLQRIIFQNFRYLRLVLAGSSSCGFAVRGSDCDFTLVKERPMPYVDGTTVLRQIKSVLELRERDVLDIELISTAVVPILTLKDTSRDLEGDISFCAENILQNTFLMRCYGEMDERVRPLVITIKTWAKNADIMNARYHYLSGFALVLLVLHYLQYGCSPPVLPSLHQRYPEYFNERDANRVADWLEQEDTPPIIAQYASANHDTLYDLLGGFFHYHSDFNWGRVISVRTGGFLPLPRNKKWTNPYIRVEDPSNLTNVARAVYESSPFEMIKAAFKRARQRIDRSERVRDIVAG